MGSGSLLFAVLNTISIPIFVSQARCYILKIGTIFSNIINSMPKTGSNIYSIFY
jgi:Ca2+/Na+ antiporter